MTRAANSDSASRDYQVGYGKTPVETRFKPGQSGNPKGRPKGLQSIGTLLQKALLTRVTLQENGRPRHITIQEVIIRGLVNDAAKRDPKAMRVLFALLERHLVPEDTENASGGIQSGDQAIIEDFQARLMANLTAAPTSEHVGDGDATEPDCLPPDASGSDGTP